MKSHVSQATWDFWKNIFPFFPVIKNLTNSCKDKRSSYQILLTADTIDKNLVLKKKKKKKKKKS